MSITRRSPLTPNLSNVLSHVFGQNGKKEYGFDNVKVTNSAWDTNVIAASTVRIHPFTHIFPSRSASHDISLFVVAIRSATFL